MKNLGSNIIAKALAGLIVLVPMAILAIAGIQIYGLLEDMAAFAEIGLPFPPIINALIFIGIAAIAMFLLCLLIGLLMSTGAGKKIGTFLQKSITDKIPLIGLVHNLTLTLTGSGNSQLQPAEIDLQGTGACMYGFVMEVLPDGRNVVFIPSAPAVTLGQIHIVPVARVNLLNSSMASVVNTITQWGAGAGDIYKES
ncbi:MAG: DUF502 domain-containing protein [Halioglobus sp.]